MAKVMVILVKCAIDANFKETLEWKAIDFFSGTESWDVFLPNTLITKCTDIKYSNIDLLLFGDWKLGLVLSFLSSEQWDVTKDLGFSFSFL